MGSRQYVLVGCVTEPGAAGAPGEHRLGDLGELAQIVVEHDIDLLVMGSDAPRLEVFGEVTESCLGLPVRLVELSSLFEEVFGHVPTAEINAAWFQCLADPHNRGVLAAQARWSTSAARCCRSRSPCRCFPSSCC